MAKYVYPMTHILSESEATITRVIWSHIPLPWIPHTPSVIHRKGYETYFFYIPWEKLISPEAEGHIPFHIHIHIPFPPRGISNSLQVTADGKLNSIKFLNTYKGLNEFWIYEKGSFHHLFPFSSIRLKDRDRSKGVRICFRFNLHKEIVYLIVSCISLLWRYCKVMNCRVLPRFCFFLSECWQI